MRNTNETSENSTRKRPPARTPEARENQIISKAYDLVEKRIDKGTATSQEVCHFLKLGSTKERMEKESLQQDIELKKAKTDQIKSQKQTEALYREALTAMRAYAGQSGDGDDYDS